MSGNGRKFVEEEFSWGGFEDTSSNIVLSPEEDLGLYMRRLTLADKSEIEVKGRKGHAFVAELEIPLLGVYALETLGFKVNPRTGEIEEISHRGVIC